MIDEDPWKNLRSFTDARIALGRAGGSLPTRESLLFRKDHALARDAVWDSLNVFDLQSKLASLFSDIIVLNSQAENRSTYLRRPDLGRRLHPKAEEQLQQFKQSYDIGIILADGLSPVALENHAYGFLSQLLPEINDYQLAPLCIVQEGRVAIGDEIGQNLQCKMTVLLVGERPGLSSPDSMGIYMTYNPKKGNTDDSRNCISNIRNGGLSYPFASQKLVYLIQESFRKKISGVTIKDDFDRKLNANE